MGNQNSQDVQSDLPNETLRELSKSLILEQQATSLHFLGYDDPTKFEPVEKAFVMYYDSSYKKAPKYFGFDEPLYQKLIEKTITLISRGDEHEDVEKVHTEFDVLSEVLIDINKLGYLTTNSQSAMSTSYIQFPYLQVSAPLYEMIHIFNTILETPKLNSRFCCSIRYLITDKHGKTALVVFSNRKPHSSNAADITEERVGLTYTQHTVDTQHTFEAALQTQLDKNNWFAVTSFPLFEGLAVNTWFPTGSMSKEEAKAHRKDLKAYDKFLNMHYANFFLCDTTFINNDMFTTFKELAKDANAS